MSEQKPRLSARRAEYDEVFYREALRSLGLFAPVQLDDINRAYRSRAKAIHPDRIAANGGGHAEATERIQALNAAHEYVVHYFPRFQRSQGRIARRYRPQNEGGGMAPLAEFVLFPVAIVYSLAALLAAIPTRFAAWLAEEKVDELEQIGVDKDDQQLPAVESWGVVGPHVVALLLFVVVELSGVGPALLGWWIGVSLLVMLSTDIASRVTGEANPLRTHRALGRVNALVRGS